VTPANVAIVREALEAARKEFDQCAKDAIAANWHTAHRYTRIRLQMDRALAALAPALAEEHRRIAG